MTAADAMTDRALATKRAVYWHSTAPPRPERLALPTSEHFDVVVVGGGLLGLWTAYHLASERAVQVLVIEQAQVGDGPSGRNAGFLNPQIGLSIRQLVRVHGESAVGDACRATRAAVHRLVDTIAKESIDCDLQETGEVIVATSDAQERKLRRDAETYRRLGIGTQLIEGPELQASIRSPTFRLGLSDPDVAIVHPTKLVRGLAGACESRGVAICEGVKYERARRDGAKIRVGTSKGEVTADNLALAMNAWAGRDRWFRRLVVPMYTHIITTAPVPEERWTEIGWDGREAISDRRGYLHYYRRTLDGRIVWGGGDAIQPYASAVASRYETNRRVFRDLRRSLYATFPQIRDHPISHEWGGPVDVTAGTFPTFGEIRPGVYYGHGFAGHGVCLSFLGGETLAALVSGHRAPSPALFLNSETKRFPLEPIRYLGGRLARYEIRRLDRKGDTVAGEVREPIVPRMVQRLSRLR